MKEQNKYLYDNEMTSNESKEELLIRVIKQYLPGLREEVERIKDRNNQYIRDIISDRTGLSLVSKKSKTSHSDKGEIKRITIEIQDRLSRKLEEILVKIPNILLVYILHFDRMNKTIDELHFQNDNNQAINSILSDNKESKQFSNEIEYLKDLKRKIEEEGIIKKILQYTPDILGEYFPNDKSIKIYWIGIGLLHNFTGIKIEDIVIITLLHELAHAYTMDGFDKDGNLWEPEILRNMEPIISECFAQIYTDLIIKENFKYLEENFNIILLRLKEEYTIYKELFILKEDNKFENLREILIKTRNMKMTAFSEFESLLNENKK